MALVYTELDEIIARGAFGGVVTISSATALFCLSAVLDVQVVSGSYIPLSDTARDQIDTWRSLAFSELRNAMIGQIVTTLTVDNPNPEVLLQLDGSSHLRADYPILWERLPAHLKTATDFTLPDANGRNLRAAPAGTAGGNDTINLTIDQLPAHAHDYQREVGTAIVQGELAPATVASTTTLAQQTSAAGSGAAVDITNSYLGVSLWIIAK